MKLKLFFLSMIFGSTLIQAQDLEVGQVIHGGSGCTKAENIVSVDSATLSINIKAPNYIAESKNKSMTRKTCMVAIPIKVPAGKKLVMEKVTGQGTLILPNQESSAEINLEAFISGGASIKVRNVLSGQLKIKELNLENDINLATECGDSILLRMNHSLLVRNASKKASSASLGLDAITIQLALIDCDGTI